MEYNSIYGYIKINRDYERSVAFIKQLGKDSSYPFINTHMFSFGDYEIPYYYEHMFLGFAASYKYFGLDLEDWNSFILKIEHILRNIDFENAQFHVDSAIGNYTLYWEWADKCFYSDERENDKTVRLIKTPEWYFGFGKRDTNIGHLDNDIHFEELQDLRNNSGLGFMYPIPQP